MNEHLFNISDILIVPLVLGVIIILMSYLKKKQPLVIQKYFFSAFFLRVFGAIAISAIVEFFYTYGDTYVYYYNAQILRTFFLKDPTAWLELLFSNPKNGGVAITAYSDMIKEMNQYAAIVFQTNENASVCKIASIFNLFCFNSSIGIALCFGLLSFMGCWYIFKAFTHVYPGYEKQFAWLCLYLPSLWFWGSGILKDPICIFALGLIFYNFFVKKGSILKRIIMIGIAAFLLLNVKSYIFYSFSVAAIIGWIFYRFKKFNFLSKAFSILLAGIIVVASYSAMQDFVTKSFEEILLESQGFIKSYSGQIAEGDATSVPVLDPSPVGFFKLSINGLVTVFLKPFPWELKKILYLFLILENLYLYIIIFKKVKYGPLDFKSNHSYLTYFSFVFFIFLGVVVGVTAFNLGTIARYRVPSLPFIFAGIFSLKLANKKRKFEITVRL